jgi:peptidoglycan hydrolase-like protein with peptidoglycan-binding domain
MTLLPSCCSLFFFVVVLFPQGQPNVLYRLATLLLVSLHAGVNGQFDVPGAVQINPQEDLFNTIGDALGISGLFGGSDDKPVKDRWYFWVIIAAVIIFVIVGSYFTIRGCRRFRKVRKENQLKSLIPETLEKSYFDAVTEEYVKDVSRRTGRPVDVVIPAAVAMKDDPELGIVTVRMDEDDDDEGSEDDGSYEEHIEHEEEKQASK